MSTTTTTSEMYVIKRDGRRENVHFDKITERLRKLSTGLHVDVTAISKKVISCIVNGITTVQLDLEAARVCQLEVVNHPDYGYLGGRVLASNLQKNITPEYLNDFHKHAQRLFHYKHPRTRRQFSLVSEQLLHLTEIHNDRINQELKHERDLIYYDCFGFRTLEKSYLLRMKRRVVETPQQMWMRVALGIHGDDIDAAIESYHLMSQGFFTHATPTLFSSGTPRPSLSSCYLLSLVENDSIEGIFDVLKACAMISKGAGGVGLDVADVRGLGSFICGTGGESSGLVPMMRVFNNTARYVDQGGGKRPGAFAMYCPIWHTDIMGFLKMKRPLGEDQEKGPDLKYALWISNLFMKRLEKKDPTVMWTLLSPDEAPGLNSVYGEEFEKLYEKYELEFDQYCDLYDQDPENDPDQNPRKTQKIPVITLWSEIISSIIQGGYFVLFKDHCNEKSNQKNVGVIRSSNLCTEIMEVTSKDEIAVCNLTSIALPSFVIDDDKCDDGDLIQGSPLKARFDFKKLEYIAGVCVRNLNKVIDIHHYPVIQTKKSNLRHRPVGIGVQGLSDVFQKVGLSYTSKAAQDLNKLIFETIQFGALKASHELAVRDGCYETFPGSPASQGIFQHDMWGVSPLIPGRHDWDQLRKDIVENGGLRNSLLTACMPTASTAQILGNSEGIDPLTTNLFSRRTGTASFLCVNKFLIRDLERLGLWDAVMKKELIKHQGSVQHIDKIPEHLKEIYQTAYELKLSQILKMSADRGAFIDQSQSLNLYFSRTGDFTAISKALQRGWKLGLKTGLYYCRYLEKITAQQSTVEIDMKKADDDDGDDQQEKEEEEVVLICRRDDPDCLACSS